MRPWSGISSTSFDAGILPKSGRRTLSARNEGSTDGGSGIFTTSSARARLGRRWMNPRSSSALISRCTPDFDFSASASFISSNEGDTPDVLNRSLMKLNNSCCLRVSIIMPLLEGTYRERLGNPQTLVNRAVTLPQGFRSAHLQYLRFA